MTGKVGGAGSPVLHFVRTALALGVLAGRVPAVAAAQDPPPAGSKIAPKIAQATRVKGVSPRIDGVMDDEAWATAIPITDFVEKVPVEGAEPKVKTEVRVVFDRDALYIGARLYRPDPKNIPTAITRRDGTSNAESLVLSFDTYHDRRTAYSFAISSGGVRSDYYHGQDSQTDRQFEYDPIWSARARVDSAGWTAEMRIPFSQLRFGARDQPWGLEIERLIPDKNMDLYWVMIPRANDQSGWSSFFGRLNGIQGVNTARGVELVPYTAGDMTLRGNQNPANPFDQKFVGRAGADLKAGIGSNLTMDATVNPDFGQVEADPAEVNLTAFETVFDEKRPFFVEGNEILTGRAQSFLGRPTYFYTRRVGGSPHGGILGDFVDLPRNTTILGAAKVTGRLPSRLSVGLLTSVTAREFARGFDSTTGVITRLPVEAPAGFGVLRLQQEVGHSQSTLGMVLTGVHRGLGSPGGLDTLLDRDAVTGGVDWRLRFKEGKYELTGWAGFSRVAGEAAGIDRIQRSSARYFQRPDADYLNYDPLRTSLTGYTASVRADKNAGRYSLWGIQLGVKSPGFEINDIGQMARADAIDFNADYQFRDTKPHRLFRYFQIGHSVVGQWDFGGERQFLRFGHNTNLLFHNFWQLSFRATYSPRAMSNSLTRGGPYMETPHSLQLVWGLAGNPSNRTTWTTQAGYQTDELGGSIYSVSAGITTRPASQWQASLTPRYSRSTNAQQYITARAGGSVATFGSRYIFATIEQSTIAAQFRLDYAFTPNFTLQAYAEPFASSGRFHDFGELARARSFDLRKYGSSSGTAIDRQADGTTTVTDGASTFTIGRPDFNVLSFRSNLVARWEWLPGSTLFVIWQQNRSNVLTTGDLVRPGSLWDATTAPGDNFFAVKISYWLKVK
ncbi:MAG: DUF5916 domain-containing protein [Gemmatimonadota bacterium]